jgi:hypothetical protein
MPDGALSEAGPNSTWVDSAPNSTNIAIISTENAAETANLSLTSLTFAAGQGITASADTLN